MSVTLPVDVGDEERVLLVPRHENAYAEVGTIAEVGAAIRLPGGGRAVELDGLHRGVIGAAQPEPSGALRVEVDEHPDDEPRDGRTRELEREYRAVVEEILELRGDDGRISAFLRSIRRAGPLADTAGYSPDLTFEQKVELLETLDVTERLELALRASSASGSPSCRSASASATTSRAAPRSSSASTSCASRWSRSARSSARTRARSSTSTARRSRRPACPEAVREQAERELARLERMGDASARAR